MIGVPQLFVLLLKLIFAIFVISFPLLGVWLASSLAALYGGSQWLAIAGGVLFFPVLPLAWDAWAVARKRKKGNAKRPILTVGDRILLRTLALSTLFIGGLLFVHPSTAFQALSARGDWMLDGRHGPTAEKARVVIFTAADQLEWLYDLTHENVYEQYDVPPAEIPTPTPIEPPPPPPPPVADPTPPPVAEPPARPPVAWPMPDTPEPLAKNIPVEHSQSIATVAKYFLDNEKDPFRRAKAIHDYVALEVTYDHVALSEDRYPPQDAKTVFATKTAVCAGYARLFMAIANQADLEAVYLFGNVRDEHAEIAGDSHAWNAVKIEDRWYLVDVTWDSPNSNDPAKRSEFRTAYFLTPPPVFGLDHFPKLEQWQLRDEPISRGEFIRQPMMTASFYRDGFVLESPERSQVTTDDVFEIRVKRTKGRFMIASFVHDDATVELRTKCDDPRYTGDHIAIDCDLPVSGLYKVIIFSGEKRFGTYSSVGKFSVTRR